MRRSVRFFLANALLAAAVATIPDASAAQTDWQSEIDAVAAKGGGRVSVPAGRHVTGGLVLRSNVELHLAKGAVLEGASSTNDYPRVRLPNSEGDWMAVVMAVGATNVAITGDGEISGNGRAFPQPKSYGNLQEGTRPRGLFFADCTGIRLTDFTLRDTGSWGCVLKCCDRVEIRRLTIDNHANANNDGIDVEASNVVIADCDIDSGDDAVCIKSNDPDFSVENVLVSNVVARSNCANFKLGTASHGIMRNILFVDCRAEAPRRDFPDLRPEKGKPFGAGWFYSTWYARVFPPLKADSLFSLNALAVECVDGGLVENITFRNVRISGTAVPIFVRGGKRVKRATGTPPGNRYVLRNVLFENVTGEALSCVPSSITGVEGCRAENVALRNVRLTAPGGGETEEERTRPVPELEGATPGVAMFGQLLPAHGLWARHVDGLRLEDVSFLLADGTFDRRDAVVLDDVQPAGEDAGRRSK